MVLKNQKLRGLIRLAALALVISACLPGAQVNFLPSHGGDFDLADAFHARASAEQIPARGGMATGDSAKAAAAAKTARPAPSDSIIAYYFHRTFRCKTCLMLEACAKSVIEHDYPQALKAGTLRWRLLNFEEPAQAESAEKYQLVGPSLVLSHWDDGVETQWKMVDEIWEHVDDPEAVSDCVREQLKQCMEGVCRHKGPSSSDTTAVPEPDVSTPPAEERQVPDND